MTQAFLEPTIIDKSNVDLFLKAISKEAIEKVEKIDEELRKIDKELEKVEDNEFLIDEIMKEYLDE